MVFKLEDWAYDSVVGFVAGTGGAALHFFGFAPYFDKYTFAGVKGGAIADILVGLFAIAATQFVGGWTKTILLILGGALMGVGVAHAAGWTAAPAPTVRARVPLRPTAPAAPPRVPTAPLMF